MGSSIVLLTVTEVAARFKCHPLTVRRWIRNGQLQAVRVGGLIRIPETELTRCIEAGLERPPGKSERRNGVAALRATMGSLRRQLDDEDLETLEHLLDEGDEVADWTSPLE